MFYIRYCIRFSAQAQFFSIGYWKWYKMKSPIDSRKRYDDVTDSIRRQIATRPRGSLIPTFHLAFRSLEAGTSCWSLCLSCPVCACCPSSFRTPSLGPDSDDIVCQEASEFVGEGAKEEEYGEKAAPFGEELDKEGKGRKVWSSCLIWRRMEALS